MLIFKNKNRYTLMRGLKLVWGVFVTLLAVFVPRQDRIVITASHNTSFNDNARAMFIALYNRYEWRHKVFFVLNDSQRVAELNQIYPGRFLTNTSLSNLLLILSARVWMTSSLEFPAPGYFNRHLRTVYHLGHGMPYKISGLLEGSAGWLKRFYYKLVTTNISYTWATTDFFKQPIADIYGVPLSRVLVLPQPKTGLLAHPAENAPMLLKDRKFTHLLYAPTWRHYADVRLFPFDDLNFSVLRDFLEKNGIVIWFRFLPKYDQELDREWLTSGHIQRLSAIEYDEVNEYLPYFDGLLTDYSSLYLDYLLLCRPVIFLDYDIDAFQKEVGLVEGVEKIKIGKTIDNMGDFTDVLLTVCTSKVDAERYNEANALVNYDLPANKILDFLVDKMQSMLMHA